MNKVIYLDLDGVVCDFITPALDRAGIMDHKLHCAGCRETGRPVVAGDFWKDVDMQFWLDLPIMDDGHKILKICESYAPVVFLSSGAYSPNAYFGKMSWILKHFPKYKKRLFVGSEKAMLSHPNGILVDDWERNITEWRAAGGHGVLLPRFWNTEHHLDTMDTLKKRLFAIFGCR